MAIIIMQTPNSPYFTTLDTGVMEVEIGKVFIGVSFVTEDGVRLSVSMRDDGFEVHYYGDYLEQEFDAGWTDFKNGTVVHNGKK